MEPFQTFGGKVVIYRIRVEGRLGPEWGELAGGMKVEVRGGHGGQITSDLVGPVADDAQLMGILDQLYTHGARLVKVDRICDGDARPSAAGTPGPERLDHE